MSTTNEPWDDPRITAYVMDELTPTDTSQFEAEMQQHPDLANAVEDARRVTGKLADFYAAIPTSTLDAARRERITGAAVTPRDDSGAHTGYSGRRIAMWAIAASVLILAVAFPLWQIPKDRVASSSMSETVAHQSIENSKARLDVMMPMNAAETAEFDSSGGEVETLATPAAGAAAETRSSAESQPLRAAPLPMMKSAPSPESETPLPSSIARRSVAQQYAEAEVADRNSVESLPADVVSNGEEMKAVPDRGMMRSRVLPQEKTQPQDTVKENANLRKAARSTDQRTTPRSPRGQFSPLGANEFLRVADESISSFSMDVDTASYAKVRGYLQNNQLPPRDAVRIEEMVNYFDYDYADDDDAGPTAIEGEPSGPFSTLMTAAICPWNSEHRLVRIGLQAERLAEQSTGTLEPVADEVKIEIKFNPAVVSAYRLIGDEDPLPVNDDFVDDKNSAGDITAGHHVIALYEVVPVGAEVDAIAPSVALKYQARVAAEPVPEPTAGDSRGSDAAKPTTVEMLTLKLRYKQPRETTIERMTRVLDNSQTPFDQADADFRFAASVAAFGMLLQESTFAGSWTFDDVLRVAEGAIDSDPDGLRSEFVGLVKTAKALTVRE